MKGKGRAYGVEFLAQRSYGKWTGWVGYTWSIANRTFPDLNQGQTYFSKYDRRHDFSIVSALDLTKRVSLSVSWVYSSGSPFTADEWPGLDDVNLSQIASILYVCYRLAIIWME